MTVCFVCFMFDCVGELFVECVYGAVKVMVLFLGCVGILLASPCIVFQRVCVFCL